MTPWLRRRRLLALVTAASIGSGCYRNAVRTRDVEEVLERSPAEGPASKTTVSTDGMNVTILAEGGRLCGSKLSGIVHHYSDTVREKETSSYVVPGALTLIGSVVLVVGLASVEGSCTGQQCLSPSYQPFVGPATALIGCLVLAAGLVSGLVVLTLPSVKSSTTRELAPSRLERWEDPDAWCAGSAPKALPYARLKLLASYPLAQKTIEWNAVADERGTFVFQAGPSLLAAQHCGEGVLEVACLSPPLARRAVLKLSISPGVTPGEDSPGMDLGFGRVAAECAATNEKAMEMERLRVQRQ